MPKIMLINVTHSEESRVAIISDKVLEAFEIESLGREHLKGNIYKGVVHRIHPALEAAFVDIGAERDAFLPIDEICFRNLRNPPSHDDGGDNGRRKRIRDLLRPGEEILVQIAKEQFANKPPTLTTFYSLPGRYLVLLPGSDDTGISRRIEGDERIRLRKLVADLNPPEGFGVIVRTAAGADEETSELARDFAYLQRVWDNVQRAAQGRRPPSLVYREHDIVLRTIRDFYTADIDEIHVDNEEVFQRAREFLRDVMPGKEHVLHLYQGEQPIFSAFDVEPQIESIFRRRVQLRSGASIVIDGTEALTAIDVNSGGSVRGHNPEETAFRTNLEAANEIARQMRLRDIGGLIVVDFIDMREMAHVHEIERAMRDAMRPDKARHELGRISRFGLMEISRQRLRPAAMATTYTTCTMCEGHGAVRTTESAALVALRKIHNRVAIGDVATLVAAVPTAVAVYLLNQKRDELARLEQRYDSRIQVDFNDRLMPHQAEIEVKMRPAAPAAARVQPGSVAAIEQAPAAQAAANGDGNGKKKRRRRGRRRGGGLRAAIAIGEALSLLGRLAGLAVVRARPGAEEDRPAAGELDAEVQLAEGEPTDTSPALEAPEPSGKPSGRRRRRRRSGGRRGAAAQPTASIQPSPLADTASMQANDEAPAASAVVEEERREKAAPAPARSRRGGRRTRATSPETSPTPPVDAPGETVAAGAAPAPGKAPRKRGARKAAAPKPRSAKPRTRSGAASKRRRGAEAADQTTASE